MQPIRALMVTVISFELLGAIVCYAMHLCPDWFLSAWLSTPSHKEPSSSSFLTNLIAQLWFGGVMAAFPGFLVGLFIQARLKPGSLGENKIMVRRLGMIAALLTLIAVLLILVPVARPMFGFPRTA
jgi:hypothetical protein